jgi:long-chain acyl-CoA synthetase
VVANLADLVRSAAAARPHHPALVTGDRTLAWDHVDAAVDAAAAGLQAMGLRRGDRVVLVLGNTPEFVSAYFGVLRAGLVAVPTNTGSTEAELTRLLADSGARAVVFDRTGASAARGALAAHPEARAVVVGAPALGETAFGSFTGRPHDPGGDPEDLALLLYTSGTGGRPKGAMLSHRALLASVEQVHALPTPAVTPDDVVLLVLPLFHVYALNGTLAGAVRAAATLVLAERFDPAETLDLVRRHAVTNVPGAPPMYVAWSQRADLGEALAGVRLLVTGAAPMPPTVRAQVETATGLTLHEGYGLTEAAPGVTSTLASQGPVRPGSVGRALPGVEVRLVDDEGEPVEDGDPGQIQVRGPNLFSGYWPDGSDGPGPDGWFTTGDVAYEDEEGDLVLVDRTKELVIVSGFNVYPREVEDVVLGLPGIREAAVVGVPHPYTGEAVKAYVVLEPGAHVAPSDVTAYVATRLARFKCPTVVEVVDALPHNATGKVVKARLRGERR